MSKTGYQGACVAWFAAALFIALFGALILTEARPGLARSTAATFEFFVSVVYVCRGFACGLKAME